MSRIFHDDDFNENNLNVEISGLTLSNGNVANEGDLTGAGGAIRSTENLVLHDLTLSNDKLILCVAKSDRQRACPR